MALNDSGRGPMSTNRDGEGWGIVPILLGILAVLAIGYMAFGNRDIVGTGPTRIEPTRTNSTTTLPPATTTTPSPTAPANK